MLFLATVHKFHHYRYNITTENNGGDIMPKRNDKQAALIGKRIRKRRKELKLTQDDLADRSGLSQSFLTCVERGEKGLGFDSIIKVSRGLEVSIDYLLTGVMSLNESNYILQLFNQLDEAQREQTISVLEHLVIIGGHTLPKL